MSRKYEFATTFRHFYGGSDNRYNRPTFDNFGPSVPRRATSPVKLQKRWYFIHDVLCHWSTFWYWCHRCKSNTLRKQASDFTWHPIIDVLLYVHVVKYCIHTRKFRVTYKHLKHLRYVYQTCTIWYWCNRCKSNTLRKQASDFTWRQKLF